MAGESPSHANASGAGGPERSSLGSGGARRAEPYSSEGPGPRPQASPPNAQAKKSNLGFRMISALGFPDVGVFRMAEALFGWKKDEGKPTSKGAPMKCIKQSQDIKHVTWAPVSAKDYVLTFIMNDESILPFVGFKDGDLIQVQRFIRHHWKKELEVTKRATRGWHWGQYDFLGDTMCVSINNDPAVYINARSIKQITNNPGKAKNELLLGFDEEDITPVGQDFVYEMKFHVVPGAEEEDKDKKDGSGEPKATQLEYLYDSLLAKSTLTSATASNVAFILEYMNLASPPGRFDIHVVRDGFKLYGKSGNFGPIPWGTVENIYHIETKPNSYLLLALSSSLRKGQTSYKHIVIQLEEKKQREISLNLAKDGPTDQRLIDEYKLQPAIKAEEKRVVPKLLAIYGNKKPQRAVMKDANAENPKPLPAIECSYKQQLGKLSFHTTCIIFAPKPPTILKHEDMAVVDFRSPSSRTRLFTFRIIMKAPRGSTPVEHSLESIDRSEFDTIYKYFIDRGIKTRTGTYEEGGEGNNEQQSANLAQMDDDSSEDEDFEDKAGSEDSDDHGMSDLDEDEDSSENGTTSPRRPAGSSPARAPPTTKPAGSTPPAGPSSGDGAA